MSEATLWNWLRPYLPQGQYSRIESPDTCPGHPDVTYTVTGKTGFIELKENTGKVRVPFPNDEKGLHLSQKAWIENCVENRGVVWIVAGGIGEVLWIHGRHADEFNGKTWKQLRILATYIIYKRSITKETLKSVRRLLL